MRGVIFNSMISTTVTMPALVLLGVMAAYWLHRRYFPDSEPRQGSYAVLAALLPVAFMLFLWPSGHVSGSKVATIMCTYFVYYLVAVVVYVVCMQMESEGRARAFRFFFVLLSAAFMMSLFLTMRMASSILSFFGLIALVWAVVYVIVKTLSSPVWVWTPQGAPARETVDAEAPEVPRPPPAPPPSAQKMLMYGGLILGVAWLSLYVYSLQPLYMMLVMFWTGIAGIAMARRAGEVSPSPGVSPSPSSPSRDID